MYKCFDNPIEAMFLYSDILFWFKQFESSTFLNETPVLIGCLQVIDVQNQWPIIFGTDLVCKNILKVTNYYYKHTNLFNNFLHNESRLQA